MGLDDDFLLFVLTGYDVRYYAFTFLRFCSIRDWVSVMLSTRSTGCIWMDGICFWGMDRCSGEEQRVDG